MKRFGRSASVSSTRRLATCGILLVALVALGPIATVSAQSESSGAPVALDHESREYARSIASNLRCPVCQGLSVADSPSDTARNMMSKVERLVAEGHSREEVENYFVERYGTWVLLEPRPEGINWMVWILPAVVLLAGAFVVWFTVTRQTPDVPASSADGNIPDDLKRQILEEVES